MTTNLRWLLNKVNVCNIRKAIGTHTKVNYNKILKVFSPIPHIQEVQLQPARRDENGSFNLTIVSAFFALKLLIVYAQSTDCLNNALVMVIIVGNGIKLD